MEDRTLIRLGLQVEYDRLEEESENAMQMSPLGFTVSNYRRWPIEKLARIVHVHERMGEISAELRRMRWEDTKASIRVYWTLFKVVMKTLWSRHK